MNKNIRTIQFKKTGSKKERNENGILAFPIYDCRVMINDETKKILKLDCPCWNFQNRRIKKVGKVQDIIFRATSPCKHLESVVNALKIQGYTFREIKSCQGLDKCTPKLRKQILTIYKGMCAIEGCEETTGLEIHRRKSGANGGKYSISNCEPLCKRHHQLITFQRYRDLK